MTRDELNKIKSACDDFSNFFRNCLDHEMVRICREYEFDKSFLMILKKYKSAKREIQEEWVNYNIMQYASTKVFTQNGNFDKFFKNSYLNTLKPEETKKLLFFKDNKWFYSVFEIKERLEENFFLIFDIAKKKTMLLESRGVAELDRRGARFFMTLLYYNKECYQTSGIIHYYKGFIPEDFQYFSKMLEPSYENNKDFSEIIERHPVPFYMLDYCSDVPLAISGKDQIGMFGSVWEIDPIEFKDFKDECEILEKDDVICFQVKNWYMPPNFTQFFYHKRKNEICVTSCTLKGYNKAIDILNKFFDRDYEPEYSCSMNMMLMTKEILRKEFFPFKYDILFNPKKSQPSENNEELKKLNSFMNDIMTAYNEGLEYDIKELSLKHDVTFENALNIEKMLNEKMKNPINIKGGFDNFTPPPPAIRDIFKSTFKNSDFFNFQNNDKVKELINMQIDKINQLDQKNNVELTADNFNEKIMLSYEKLWNTIDQTLLQYTVYLLLKRGKEYITAKDCAVEFINLFGHVYFDHVDEKVIKSFIKDYVSKLLISVFFKFGLIEIENITEKNMHEKLKIKTTILFNEWIKLRKEYDKY